MLTRSQINRAGRRLRKAETPDEADRQIYDEFRATFAEPLAEVVEALRGVAGGAPVTYRLKRFETTVEKLRRLTSDLARLEDIAGCRVVVPTMREQRELLAGIRRDLDVVRERDYQAEPRGGYRALHAVVRAHGQMVEVQLRTELAEQWANTAERLAGRFDPEIKYGGGPPGIRDILNALARIFGESDAIRYRYIDEFEVIRNDSLLWQSSLNMTDELEFDTFLSAIRGASEAIVSLDRAVAEAMIARLETIAAQESANPDEALREYFRVLTTLTGPAETEDGDA